MRSSATPPRTPPEPGERSTEVTPCSSFSFPSHCAARTCPRTFAVLFPLSILLPRAPRGKETGGSASQAAGVTSAALGASAVLVPSPEKAPSSRALALHISFRSPVMSSQESLEKGEGRRKVCPATSALARPTQARCAQSTPGPPNLTRQRLRACRCSPREDATPPLFWRTRSCHPPLSAQRSFELWRLRSTAATRECRCAPPPA